MIEKNLIIVLLNVTGDLVMQ